MFFNWGKESDSDRTFRLKLEDELLFEQSKFIQTKKRAAAGASAFFPLLGAYSFPTMERYNIDSADVGNNTTIDLNLSEENKNLFIYPTLPREFSLTNPNRQHPATKLESNEDIEYATFAYNYDDGLIYYVYYNPSSDALEFRSLNPKNGDSTYINDLTSGYVTIRELLYIGNNEFIFLDPSDNTIVTMDTTGDITDVVTSAYSDQMSTISKYNEKYYVTSSYFDLNESYISEIDIDTGTVSSSNFIYFNESLNQIEPFASIDPIEDPSPDLKVVDVIAIASIDEVPRYSAFRKMYAILLLWNDDANFDFITDPNDINLNAWCVFAELDPTTGEATYIGDGSGVYDLFYYKR
jgi:hypothetical protein